VCWSPRSGAFLAYHYPSFLEVDCKGPGLTLILQHIQTVLKLGDRRTRSTVKKVTIKNEVTKVNIPQKHCPPFCLPDIHRIHNKFSSVYFFFLFVYSLSPHSLNKYHASTSWRTSRCVRHDVIAFGAGGKNGGVARWTDGAGRRERDKA